MDNKRGMCTGCREEKVLEFEIEREGRVTFALCTDCVVLSKIKEENEGE